jgi:hypothetical protein
MKVQYYDHLHSVLQSCRSTDASQRTPLNACMLELSAHEPRWQLAISKEQFIDIFTALDTAR